jgi:hypothetical protein
LDTPYPPSALLFLFAFVLTIPAADLALVVRIRVEVAHRPSRRLISFPRTSYLEIRLRECGLRLALALLFAALLAAAACTDASGVVTPVGTSSGPSIGSTARSMPDWTIVDKRIIQAPSGSTRTPGVYRVTVMFAGEERTIDYEGFGSACYEAASLGQPLPVTVTSSNRGISLTHDCR